MSSPAPARLQAITSEEDLVLAARSGGRAAFEQLYRLHVGRVHALCLRLSGDRDAAEQLVQDAFVRAWRKLPDFRGESGFGTWLHRVTVTAVLDWQRARARRQRRETAVDPLDGPAEVPPARWSPPLPAGEGLDLERAIAALPDGARVVFVLHEVAGYPVREVAGLLQIAEGTVKAQLFRARRQLREVLR